MNDVQLNHYETMSKMPEVESGLYLYLCGTTPENIGLIKRSADAMGVKGIFYYDPNLTDGLESNKKLQKAARNSTVPIRYEKDIESLKQLKERGYEIVALEITKNSTPVRKKSWNTQTILVAGNEKNGVPQEILDIADSAVHIEMIGKNISSLNVAVATSISLNDYVCKLLERQEKEQLFQQEK